MRKEKFPLITFSQDLSLLKVYRGHQSFLNQRMCIGKTDSKDLISTNSPNTLAIPFTALTTGWEIMLEIWGTVRLRDCVLKVKRWFTFWIKQIRRLTSWICLSKYRRIRHNITATHLIRSNWKRRGNKKSHRLFLTLLKDQTSLESRQ